MENFFIDDQFFSDLCEYMESRELEEDNIPDDWSEVAIEGDLQPMLIFNIDWIFDRIDEERDDENNNSSEKLIGLFKKHIDFDAINNEMPKLYYPTRKKFDITKRVLLDYCN